MELLFSVLFVLTLSHVSWAQTTADPGIWMDSYVTVNYGNPASYQDVPATPSPPLYNDTMIMEVTTPYSWNIPQNDTYGTGSYGGGTGTYTDTGSYGGTGTYTDTGYSGTGTYTDTGYSGTGITDTGSYTGTGEAYSGMGSFNLNDYYSGSSPTAYSPTSTTSTSTSSSPELEYLRQLISTMPKFSIAEVPVVLDLLRQKKNEMAQMGQVMTAQDMGQVLLDFQARKGSTATSLTTSNTGTSGTTSALGNIMGSLGTTGTGSMDPMSLLQGMQSGSTSALTGGATSSSPTSNFLGLTGGTTQSGNFVTNPSSMMQQSSPYAALLQKLSGTSPTTAGTAATTAPLSMLGIGSTNPLSALTGATAANPLAALMPQTGATAANPLAALMSQTGATATNPLAALMPQTGVTAANPLAALSANPLASLSPLGSTATSPIASLLQPSQPGAGGVDLTGLLNSVTGNPLTGAGSSLLNMPGAGLTVGAAGLDLMSILGAVPNSLGLQGGGTGSLLNSVVGGGVGGAGSPLGEGPFGVNNAIGSKPPALRRNSMEMMIPAMAMSTGMDGPWGAMAMMQAMRRGGGMQNMMRNPIFMYNMMSGGEMFSF